VRNLRKRPDNTSPTLSKGEEEHGLGMLYSVLRALAAPSPVGEGGGRGEKSPALIPPLGRTVKF